MQNINVCIVKAAFELVKKEFLLHNSYTINGEFEKAKQTLLDIIFCTSNEPAITKEDYNSIVIELNTFGSKMSIIEAIHNVENSLESILNIDMTTSDEELAKLANKVVIALMNLAATNGFQLPEK